MSWRCARCQIIVSASRHGTRTPRGPGARRHAQIARSIRTPRVCRTASAPSTARRMGGNVPPKMGTDMAMRIGIVGAGAIGCVVGGLNDAVVAEVRRHGVGTLTPDPKNLEPVLAVLPR